MASLDPDETNVPWGKYTYALEGLATGCYMEGAADKPSKSHPHASGQKLRFRVELPARCFVLSVAVKLPNAPEHALSTLDDIRIERTLSNGEYETVFDPVPVRPTSPQHEKPSNPSPSPPVHDSNTPSNQGDIPDSTSESSSDSPTSIEQTAAKNDFTEEKLPRKKVMEVRRAADSLRLTITDVDEKHSSHSEHSRDNHSDDGSDNGDFRILGIVVIGYVRGQTPASNRINILLNSSAKLGVPRAKADRAEVDALLGLAFLGNRRYRQAAELLQRASELVLEVADDDAKSGFASGSASIWAAELNLLSAHAYFEHMPMSNDGIVRLVHVAGAAKSTRPKSTSPRDLRDLNTEFLDLRTELLSMLPELISMLVQFLGDSNSLAVKMASARMIEFISEQLGCAIAKHMSEILNQVLRAYSGCVAFGARERAAACSFSYDSMEDCYERLIDISCRLFPLTEHGVLLKLYHNTLIPLFLDGFRESEYLHYEPDAEEDVDDLMTTAVAQTLRVIYLALAILGGDARIPTSFLTRILNMLVTENGSPRTPLLLRRTALHMWDALSRSLTHSAIGNTIKAFTEYVKVLKDFIPKLLVEFSRPTFEYGELEEEDGEVEVEVIKEDCVTPENNTVLKELLNKRDKRVEIVDRHTLRRVLKLIHDVCDALKPTEEEEDRCVDVLVSLQEVIGRSIADLVMSALIDVSYHEAVVSGNGPEEANNVYEFGDIHTQLTVISEVLGCLFWSYWAVIKLLPSRMAADAVRTTPIRSVLGWCVDRMAHSAPPRGMLRLLCVTVKGLQNELNSYMHDLPAVPSAPHEITFIAIFRAHLIWLPQSLHEEAFDLADALINSVSNDLMAKDLVLLIQGLGDQNEQHQTRTEASLELLASVVSTSVPTRPDLAMSSLKALEDPNVGKQRIANGFPKSNRSNTGSFSRRIHFAGSSPRKVPMSNSFYLHVVLASCFDRFDSLARASRQRAGPSYMGEKIDAFVEHAALSVRCLHACARARTHREYVGAVLGDIFGTCLAMQDHGDGRVRLAGFEIFAAALDVLFLAQKAMVLVHKQLNLPSNDISGSAASCGNSTAPTPHDQSNGVTELAGIEEIENVSPALVPPAPQTAVYEFSRSSSLPTSLAVGRNESIIEENLEEGYDEDVDADVERKMQLMFAEGGSCYFQSEDASPSELSFEERAWQMLCAFVTSSLGIGKYVDFVVQRACLEYLKGCMLNALRGRSTGASVIAFEHIELLWDAVNRLVGSPWRALNSLAMWVICTILNVALYSSVMAKGRGAIRQRASQLNDFLSNHVFSRAESLLKSGCRETRIWGMRLLEVYIKARDQNSSIVQVVPPPPGRVLRGLDQLKHDWDLDVQERCKALINTHVNTITRKTSSHVQSFTAQAQNFMSMKRNQLDELDGSDSSRVHLWFPPLPRPVPSSEMEVYCRTLEAFANTLISGGEETDVTPAEQELDDDEEEYEAEFDEDEEAFEIDEEEKLEEYDVDQASTEEENELTIADETVMQDKSGESISNQHGETINSMNHLSKDDEEHVKSTADTTGDSETTMDDTNEADREKSGVTQDGENDFGNDDVEVEEDHEFSSFQPEKPNISSAGAPFFTEVSDPDEEENGNSSSIQRKGGSYDDDFEDEEEVVNVTDEDDVLVDVDSVAAEKKLSKRTSGNSFSRNSMGLSSRSRLGDPGERIRRQGSAAQATSPTAPKPELNPDLEEGLHVLRRKGSFTSRSSLNVHLAEGDVPKLARRRSMDISAMSSVIDMVGEVRPHGRDGDDVSPVSSSRLSRRKSMKSPGNSPRLSDAARSKSGDTFPFGGDQNTRSASGESDAGATGSGRLMRRRSAKSMSSGAEDNLKDSKPRKSTKDKIGDNVVGGAFLNLSPTGSQVPRGVKLDDNSEEGTSSRSSSPHQSMQKAAVEKPRNKQSSGSRSTRRLPRAPAFVKGGGGLQRKIPAPLPLGNSGEGDNDPQAKQERPAEVGSATGGSSTLGLSGSHVKSRLPRGRSHSNKPARLDGISDPLMTDRKVDRSHRYSKREPLSRSLDDADEFDKELLGDLEGDLDSSLNELDDLGNQVRVGTPTAESLKGRHSLADDAPGSGYKRPGSKRNVAESLHYKSLLDQIGTTPTEEDMHSSTSWLNSRRDGDKNVRRDGTSSGTGGDGSSPQTPHPQDTA